MKEPKTALVVIDMQQQFKSSALPALPAVQKAIAHAKRKGWLIVNVMFIDESRIWKPNLLTGLRTLHAKSVIQVTKDDDNGGNELHDALKSHKVERAVFCGVNATACVCRTVSGYALHNPKVECIISEALGNDVMYRKPLNVQAALNVGRPNVRAEIIFGGE